MHSYDLLCTAKSFWLKCALIFEVRSRRGPLCLCSGTKSVANARHINNWTHSTRMNMIRTAAHSWCSNYLGALKVLFFEPKVLYRAKIEGGMSVCLFNLRHGIKDSVFFVCDFHSSLDDESLYVTICSTSMKLWILNWHQAQIHKFQLVTMSFRSDRLKLCKRALMRRSCIDTCFSDVWPRLFATYSIFLQISIDYMTCNPSFTSEFTKPCHPAKLME